MDKIRNIRPRGRAGKGRPPGSLNKTTAGAKAMVLGALEQLGGQQWLVEQARENPTAFLKLLERLIPRAVEESDAGDGDDLFIDPNPDL
jgi:hypothetical protein